MCFVSNWILQVRSQFAAFAKADREASGVVQDAEDITAAEDRRLLVVAGEIVADAT